MIILNYESIRIEMKLNLVDKMNSIDDSYKTN